MVIILWCHHACPMTIAGIWAGKGGLDMCNLEPVQNMSKSGPYCHQHLSCYQIQKFRPCCLWKTLILVILMNMMILVNLAILVILANLVIFIADVLLFPMLYNMWVLTWFWDYLEIWWFWWNWWIWILMNLAIRLLQQSFPKRSRGPQGPDF